MDDSSRQGPPLRPKDLADHLLAHGTPVVTLAEAAALLGQSLTAAATTLHRLQRRGLLFRPARGLYIAVSPEYRTWNSVPAMDFIDPMMRILGRRYYVGLLSAAELWGASHQRPQVFQVLVDEHVRDRAFGRVRLRFYEAKQAKTAETIKRNTSTGQAEISPTARTCLDLWQWVHESGGLSNVATVVADLVEQHALIAQDFIDLASDYPSSVLRRLGFGLHVAIQQGSDAQVDLDALAAVANPDAGKRATAKLDPSAPQRGAVSNRWGLVINGEVEVDQ